jgi:hypothetical protein
MTLWKTGKDNISFPSTLHKQMQLRLMIDGDDVQVKANICCLPYTPWLADAICLLALNLTLPCSLLMKYRTTIPPNPATRGNPFNLLRSFCYDTAVPNLSSKLCMICCPPAYSSFALKQRQQFLMYRVRPTLMLSRLLIMMEAMRRFSSH